MLRNFIFGISLITTAACILLGCPKSEDLAGAVEPHRAALQPLLDTVKAARESHVPIDERKFAMEQFVELDAAQIEALKKEPALIVTSSSSSDTDTFNRCERILNLPPKRLEELLIGAAEISKRLAACKTRYVVVIDDSGRGGNNQYASEDGKTAMQLSTSGVFQVWEVPAKKRIITLQFPITEAAPSEIKADYEVNARRLSSAGRAAYDKMLTLKPFPKP